VLAPVYSPPNSARPPFHIVFRKLFTTPDGGRRVAVPPEVLFTSKCFSLPVRRGFFLCAFDDPFEEVGLDLVAKIPEWFGEDASLFPLSTSHEKSVSRLTCLSQMKPQSADSLFRSTGPGLSRPPTPPLLFPPRSLFDFVCSLSDDWFTRSILLPRR